MLYLGIDPGANGGLAWLDERGCLVDCIKMPPTSRDVFDAVGRYPDAVCCIEKVGGMTGQSATASFTFGKGFGELTMALVAHAIPAVLVSPARWQKHFNLSGRKGEGKTSHKNRIKQWAQLRYPSQKVTLWAADALAIATYAYESRQS